MLKDITIGQYVPGNSAIHRLDPRVKLVISLAFIILVFFIKSYVGYLIAALFLAGAVLLSRLSFRYLIRGIKPLLFIIVLTFVLNLFLSPGETVWFQWWILKFTQEGLIQATYLAVRLIMLVLATSLLTLTTSPMALTDGLERLMSPLARIGFPAHELAMMMTIALRFIPTLLEETDKIMKAQMARGADFESGNLLARAKSLVPLLVPLFVSAFRRADELARAMEARCYRGGAGRTRMKVMRMGALDVRAAVIFLALTTLILLDYWRVWAL